MPLLRLLILGFLLIPAPAASAVEAASPAPAALSASSASPTLLHRLSAQRALLVLAVCIIILLAVMAAYWRRIYRRLVTAQTDTYRRARRAQEHLLPPLPEIPGWTFHLHFRPAESVSGDFYQVARLQDGRLLLVLGDVSGHGMDAALVATAAAKDLQLRAGRHRELAVLLAESDESLRRDLDLGCFVTLVALAIDAGTGRIDCVRAGHPPPFVQHPDGGLQPLGQPGSALGLGEPGPHPLASIVLPPGGRIVLYTDGLTETRDSTGRDFGKEGLLESLHSSRACDGQASLETLMKTLSAFGPSQDDVTVLLITRLA